MKEKKELSEFLCTKLCHDLAGPITGIYNGAELLEEDDETMKQQALELITDSAIKAFAKLKFLRLAFGSAKGDIAELHEIKEVINSYLTTGKLAIEWETALPGIPNYSAKIVSIATLLASSLAIFGGKIKVILNSANDILVSATAEKFKTDENFDTVIINRNYDAELTSFNTLHFYFLKLIEENSFNLTVEKESGLIKIAAKK